MGKQPTRRDVVRAGGVALGLAAMGAPALAVAEDDKHAKRKRVARFAHITDAHVNGKNGSDRGLRKCFEHIQQHSEPIDFVLNTGDSVMCVNNVDRAEAKRQWTLWEEIVTDSCRLPIFHALGNHDSWGWKPPTPEEPTRGKAWAQDVLRLPERYYSFQRSGWVFVVLDSIMGSYTGKLDAEQREWLEGELKRIPDKTPICVATHIPIVTACGFFDGDRFGQHGWTIPGSWMHEDAKWLKDLFARHGNVKLCLSGHMHQLDRIDFQGVSYVCSGAVSASWWGGKYYACDYGYSVIDLFDDGGFAQEYVAYGWGA